MSDMNEADTRAKLIDPAIHARGWTEDHIKREESAGAVEIVAGKGVTFKTLRYAPYLKRSPAVRKPTLPLVPCFRWRRAPVRPSLPSICSNVLPTPAR